MDDKFHLISGTYLTSCFQGERLHLLQTSKFQNIPSLHMFEVIGCTRSCFYFLTWREVLYVKV